MREIRSMFITFAVKNDSGAAELERWLRGGKRWNVMAKNDGVVVFIVHVRKEAKKLCQTAAKAVFALLLRPNR